MRTMLSILALLMAAPAFAVAEQPQVFTAPEAPLRHYEWAQIFPVTPAFSDWVQAGDLTDKRDGAEVGQAWLHRDSLRIKTSASGPIIEADILVYYNGHGGLTPGYSRLLAIIGCGQPTITLIKAAGAVTISDGAIRIASELTEVHGIWYDLGITTPICTDPDFKERFLARG